MSEELKDGTVIGCWHYQGKMHDIDEPIELGWLFDDDEKGGRFRTWLRIGKAACEAKEWEIEAENIMESWRRCEYRENSLQEFFMSAMTSAYAAGLAAGQKAEHDAMLLNVPKVRRKLNLGNTGEPQ